KVFSGNDFRYIEEWHGRDSAVLEFVAELDGIHVNGVDLMHWDEHNRITSFKVMIRPLQGLQAVIPLMGIELSQS
ncbi:MAG: nuclear transport factor 2 family protein, partial [Mycobacteriaceae bacterium]